MISLEVKGFVSGSLRFIIINPFFRSEDHMPSYTLSTQTFPGGTLCVQPGGDKEAQGSSMEKQKGLG